MISLLLRAVVAVGCAAAISSAQTTWKVNCNGGPGIDFTDLAAAVAAASDGDTIWVISDWVQCPGVLQGPASATIDKELNVVGIRLYQTPPATGSPPLRAGVTGVLEIANVPAGKRVLVSNLTALPDSAYSMPWGLNIHDCAGEVLIDGLWTGTQRDGHVLQINDCSDVKIKNSTIFFGPSPLVITNSTVEISWTSVLCYFPPAQVGGYAETQPAIFVQDSDLTITGGSLIRGAYEFQTSYGWWGAKPGIIHENSTLNIGPAVTLTGGRFIGGGYNSGYIPYSWIGGSASAPPSVIHKDPRGSINGGFPTATVVDLPATYTQPAVANQDMGVVIAGPPDGFALLMLSDLPMAPTATPFGPTLLDPLTTTAVDLHFLPATSSIYTSGMTSKYYFVPSSALYGHAYVLQSLTLSPAGELGFTSASPFLIGWEHGLIP